MVQYLDVIKALTVGLLLGIIFLGFLPKIIEGKDEISFNLGILILMGIFLFYILELFLHWHHCNDIKHDHHEEEHRNGMLMFAGTLLHNIFHGIVLFSAFSVDLSF